MAYRKHRDIHTRPYICRVPGCEKIQGFTYSGGLLRHEREVHQQHGGPIKRHFCPHADCKRSEQEFSRKENLTEHLRRVHRNQALGGSALVKSELVPPPSFPDSSSHNRTFSSGSSTKRKRQKEPFDEEGNSRQMALQIENAHLRDDNNRLKQQLHQRDATIAHLNSLLGAYQAPQ